LGERRDSKEMAKILVVADAPHWTGMNVAKGIQKHSKHDVTAVFWWFQNKYHDVNPADYDITYLHSGSILRRHRFEEIQQIKECKWIMGFRGATAVHRLGGYFDDMWDGYAVASKELLEQVPEPKFLCHTGIDTKELFVPLPYPEKFRFGWAGTPSAGAKKFSHLVQLPFDRILAGPSRKTDSWYGLVKGYKHDAMPSFYEQCSVYVSTSVKEGSPAPPREAAACGRPVVAVRAGDLVEWMPEENLVDDWQELIPLIKKYKRGKKLLMRDGIKFRELSLQWDFSKVVKEYDYMFDKVLE